MVHIVGELQVHTAGVLLFREQPVNRKPVGALRAVRTRDERCELPVCAFPVFEAGQVSFSRNNGCHSRTVLLSHPIEDPVSAFKIENITDSAQAVVPGLVMVPGWIVFAGQQAACRVVHGVGGPVRIGHQLQMIVRVDGQSGNDPVG